MGAAAEIIGLDVAPDDQTAALEIRDPIENTVNLWLMDLGSGNRRRLTFSDGWNAQPIWSPDGRRVSFVDDADRSVYTNDVGGGPPELVYKDALMPMDWSSDGRFLVLSHDGALDTAFDIQLLSLEDGATEMYLQSEFIEWEAAVSPNSRWLTYVSDEDGDFGVYVDSWVYPGFPTTFC